jgi:hypothetical protein
MRTYNRCTKYRYRKSLYLKGLAQIIKKIVGSKGRYLFELWSARYKELEN